MGGEIPKPIKDKPSELGIEWYLMAFSDLTTCRAIGMAVGPIPWTAIQKYIEVHEIKGEEALNFHEVIRHMDNVWLNLAVDSDRSSKDPTIGNQSRKELGQSSRGG